MNTNALNLLALSLQRSSAINAAVYGCFTAPKKHEFVVAKGNVIELFRPDETGKVCSICTSHVFSTVRSLLQLRLFGSNKDYLLIGSDSGKISIVEFDTTINDWKILHCETFGKTGCRRIVPGQYLAADPLGRAIMVAGIEKQKFVYVMNRDSANRLTISSPLEAHKSETILYSVVGVDVGLENPVFAMIELEYTEADQDPTGEAAAESEKRLTYYELDTGLNHVVRKWSEPISRTANLLLTVPGGDDGPSGVLICGENWISYKHQGHVEVRTPLPRRADMPNERGLLITTGTVHKQKGLFFFMIQSELGDIYKVTLEISPSEPKIVKNVIVTVFDSVQIATNLCITKTGLLFVASEFGNHALFQFHGLGDDPNAVRAEAVFNEELGDDSISASHVAPRFSPSPKLQNLALLDDIQSLAPVTDMLVDDFSGEGSSQIYTLCGRGNRSSLRCLRHGVSVTEIAVSELPGRPNAVWTIKGSNEDQYDKYIVVSFSNATMVLSIGETVEEVTDTGFLSTVPTLETALLADNAMIQVHINGIRHIRPDKRTSEWKTPGKRYIEKAAINSRQVVISLAGGEIIYFEVDAAGQLMEMGTLDMGKDVVSLDIGVVPPGRARSQFLAVGCADCSVQVFSLDPADILNQRSAMSVPARPDSLCLVHMAKERGGGSAGAAADSIQNLYIYVGLQNGILVRVAADPVTGSLSDDARKRFLGPKSIKLFRVTIQGQLGVLALCTRPWVMYNFQGRYFQAPLSYEALEYGANFISEVCPEGIVAVAADTLRIIAVENLGTMFNQVSYPLRYTPRKMCRVPFTNQLIVVESDHNEFNESEKMAFAAQSNTEMVVEVKRSGGEEEEEEEAPSIPLRGPLPPMTGKWASCIRVIEPLTGLTRSIAELANNEAAFSVCTCKFTQHSEETFVIVGIAKNLTLHPRNVSAAYINTYRLLDGTLQLLHQTEIEDVPLAMCEFHGKLLIGIGKSLRLYDMGKRKLLRKCENRMFPSMIVRLQHQGDRIFVGDMCESVHFVKYHRRDNVLAIFADDTIPRFVTTLAILDYATVCGGDKFGNVFVLRLPDDTDDNVETSSGSRMLWDQGLLNGAPKKADCLTQYFLGEAVTGMAKCSFITGAAEVVVVSTIYGGIYAFTPLTPEDASFFHHLEMFLRQEYTNLCQRDHLQYRSFYQPVKHTIDGDLCERFGSMPYLKQKQFADDIDRSTTDVMKKIEEARNII